MLCGFLGKAHGEPVEKCRGAEMSVECIAEIAFAEYGEVRQRSAVPECKFAGECQWQRESGERPCPPRFAVMVGVDPVHARM